MKNIYEQLQDIPVTEEAMRQAEQMVMVTEREKASVKAYVRSHSGQRMKQRRQRTAWAAAAVLVLSIGSAGYVWCEVQKDCIRLFEKGIRTESVDDSNASAFIVFSPDSTQLELFFSNNQPNEILERRGLPSGGYAWNVEDDDTKNVRLIDGLWTISQRNKLIYSQKAGN